VRTYLPDVEMGSGPSVQGGPEGYGVELNPIEDEFLRLMRSHVEQGRVSIEVNLYLMAAAYDKVVRMARGGWVGHVDPLGEGPNDLVRRFGYELPDWYSHEAGANGVESLRYGGSSDPAWSTAFEAFEGLLGSPSHRIHILGLDRFYAHQRSIGIAYYHDGESERFNYWCVITAPIVGSIY
jgi:uncharacterized protein YkwD